MKILTHGSVLGLMLLAIAVALAWDTTPHPFAYLLVHVAMTALIILFLNRIARAGNILIAVYVVVVLMFSIFCAYILTVMDRVVAEPMFEFAVFTFDSVKRALLLNDFAFGIAMLIYGFHPRILLRSRLFSYDEFRETARRLSGRAIFYPLGLCLCWTIILLVFILTPNVLQFPYPENYLQPRNISSLLRAALVLVPFLFSIIRFVHDEYRITFGGVLFRATTYVAVFAIGLMCGSRGPMVGILIGMLFLDAAYCRSAFHWKSLSILVGLAYLIFAVINWPDMRTSISAIGFIPAFTASFVNYGNILLLGSGSNAVFLSDFPMLGQSLFHFLYTIALVDSGQSLHYQTFLNLIPQQLPEILDGILWTRPINDNWLLADHFRHGGGFYSYANAYWNGGVVALGLFSGLLALIIARIEIFFKRLPIIFLAAYFVFLLLVPIGLYYGIQGLLRGIEDGFAAYLAIYIAAGCWKMRQTRSSLAAPRT